MGSSNRRELTSRQRYWLEHIQACEASGQKMSAYATAQGLRPRALYDARKRLVQQGVIAPTKRGRLGFQRVQVADTPTRRIEQYRIHLPNGAVIELGGERVDLPCLLQAVASLP
jgi:hypothetical protein